jgi:membrane protein implicated in regulation of membrane protease activity
MSNAVVALVAVVWLSLVAVGALWVVQRSPKRRKPADELEAADAALRGRIVELEDRFESHVKRDAVRSGRARVEDGGAQAALPFDRATRLQAVRERGHARGLK